MEIGNETGTPTSRSPVLSRPGIRHPNPVEEGGVALGGGAVRGVASHTGGL